MVSNRCKMAVKEELKKLDLNFIMVNLGEVEIMEELDFETHKKLESALLNIGLELIDDKKAMLIERVKILIIEMIHHSDTWPKINISDYLSEKLNCDYTHLAHLFSEKEATTIAQFIVLHKIERVKELITYDDLNITEIAWKMNYSSVAHLSNQFKKVTGLSPSHFKSMKERKRNSIEDLGKQDILLESNEL